MKTPSCANGRTRSVPWHLVLAATLACVAPAPVRAQNTGPSHAKLQVLSEDVSFKAGSVTWIGVLFDLEPGWHIYWVNPGDAGDPPRIEWGLPPGFRVEDVRWPVPSRLVTTTLVDYGYEGSVLLAVPLRVPAGYRMGTPFTVSADVRYVICREVCISARAQPSTILPVKDPMAIERSRQLFRATRLRWPKPMPPDWQASAVDTGGQFIVSFQTGMREAAAAFFPLDADQIDNAAVQIATPQERGVRVALVKADPAAKPITTLRGLMVLGLDRAFEIAAPVTMKR
jgi:thiol:disulfide interchange protein DsbD